MAGLSGLSQDQRERERERDRGMRTERGRLQYDFRVMDNRDTIRGGEC